MRPELAESRRLLAASREVARQRRGEEGMSGTEALSAEQALVLRTLHVLRVNFGIRFADEHVIGYQAGMNPVAVRRTLGVLTAAGLTERDGRQWQLTAAGEQRAVRGER